MWEIEFKFINEFGEEFKVSRKVEKDWEGLTEVEFLHDTYKNFLNNYGFPVDCNEEIDFVTEEE